MDLQPFLHLPDLSDPVNEEVMLVHVHLYTRGATVEVKESLSAVLEGSQI